MLMITAVSVLFFGTGGKSSCHRFSLFGTTLSLICSCSLLFMSDYAVGIITVLLVISYGAIIVMMKWRLWQAIESMHRHQHAHRSCIVKRDAKWIRLPVHELVPGDVVKLRVGSVVPAVSFTHWHLLLFVF
jgi:magnesium-transporting ATPase (P-type)